MAEVQVQDKGGKNGKVRSKKMSTKVDMTPMVDLGFLLITFFMFTTTFSKPNVMDLTLPAKPPKDRPIINEIDLRNSLTFIIAKDEKVFYHQLDEAGLNKETLNETSFNASNIEKVIDQARKNATKEENFTIIIKPMKDSNWKNFVDIMDELAITNSQRYGIAEIKAWEEKIYKEKTGQ